MVTIQCLRCGEEMRVKEGRMPRVCPFCGKPFAEEPDPMALSPLDERLLKERSPQKKYRMIQEALSAAPNDFSANRALLFHGRLHEPMRGNGVDFSIIKSHLFSVFEKPEAYGNAALEAKYDELLRGPQLQKTMSLAPDAEKFFEAYLRRLAREYIDLFIRGASRNNQSVFGFALRDDSVARKCVAPVRRMLRSIRASERLDDQTKLLLLDAVKDGYASLFPNFGDMLDTPEG
ncbi:MAG: hypothetical protein FWF69_10735 [Firmicutes bacterium]|nr:hypothetical protein [Bacillota bacterium]